MWRVLVLSLLVGCTRTVYQPVVRTNTVIDTVTRTVGDSAMIRALFECDSAGRVLIRELEQTKGLFADQQMSFDSGRLEVVTKWQTQYIERRVELRDTITLVQTQQIVRREAYVPQFFWWCLAVTVIVIGYGVYRLVKLMR